MSILIRAERIVKFRKGACGALFVGLWSCDYPALDCSPWGLSVSDSFSPRHHQAIRNASARWNAFTGTKVTHVNEGPRDFCELRPSQALAPNARLHMESGVVEVRTWLACEDGVPYSEDLACFEVTVMHEMGHVLGFEHMGNGIMRGTGGAAPDFTASDRDQCVALRICKDL